MHVQGVNIILDARKTTKMKMYGLMGSLSHIESDIFVCDWLTSEYFTLLPYVLTNILRIF